jgi:hypothetical protein
MFALSKSATADHLQLDTTLEGKPFRLTLTEAAHRALAQRATPLIAEMEFYFSCLIRLRVLFYEQDEAATAIPITPQLSVRFRPVMSRRCDLHAVEGKSPLDDFPLVKRAPYVPHWLHLDYKKGAWVGEFGYQSTHK